MRTISIDTEYDYLSPFLATVTNDILQTKVFKLKILSHKKELKRICEDTNVIKIFHHASGDMLVLRNIGIKVAFPYEDTLIVSNLVDENYSSRNLKKLVQTHLDIDTKEANRLKSAIKKYKEIAKGEGRRFKWSDIPNDIIIPYAKRDPEYTIKLWYYWQEPLKEYRKLYDFEKSIIPIIVNMGWKGMRIDRYLCRRKSYEYGKKLENLHEGMSKYLKDNKIGVEKEFNPRSVPQIQNIIIEMGIDSKRDEKTGLPKTDKDVLLSLSVDYNFFKLLTQYRFFSKHKTTYYDPLYEYYTSEKDDRAHFMLYQTGAKSGRFSAEVVQTFPKSEESKISGQAHEVRRCVIPGRGKVFLCKDYEQQEMRLFIHYSNCKRMIDVINSKGGRGVDCYVETAELLFGKLFEREKLRKALRWVSKHNSLGLIYGEGVRKLVWSTAHLMGDKFDKEVIEELNISEQWAYDVVQKYYKLYPVREYMQNKISELYKEGHIRLTFNSSLMDFSRDYRVPKDKAYKVVNIIIQGTAAYIIKHAMLRVDNRIRKEGWGSKVEMIMQVHDELIFEVDRGMDLKYVDQVLNEEMEDHITFKVPITCSGKWSDKSWGDVIDLK